MPDQATRSSVWLGIVSGLTTFVLTVIAAIFLFGRQIGTLRQELNDLVRWKTEAAPRIEKMDRQGSISFENFLSNYEKEQAKQYERLQHLEREVGHLDEYKLRIERLERNHTEDKKRP